MILVVDNFDSFTYNLVDYFNQLEMEVEVQRNDAPLDELLAEKYSAVVLSPGPGVPLKAGNLTRDIDQVSLMYFGVSREKITDLPIAF